MYDPDEARLLAHPLSGPETWTPLLDRIADAKLVLIGEASHGTHEYYRWRAELSQRLIAERGFSFVAVEGDWPDCERIDHSVRLEPGAPDDPRAALEQFRRWPAWMWANEEVYAFAGWLREHNAARPRAARVGFHGLDVYSLWESLRAILLHLREHDPDRVADAVAAYRCFEPYGEDPHAYAVESRFVPPGCEQEVLDLLVRMRRAAIFDGDAAFSAWQNAEVALNAERYYRAMLRGGADSWNVRDVHMADTLDRLLHHYGPQAKGIVWAHNTHVGDARATDMAASGIVNIGQFARERHRAEDVVLVGFGGYHGTVIAGERWGAPPEAMTVPHAMRHSLEDLLHATGLDQALFVFPADHQPDWLTDTLPHRAIGVVYHPEREQAVNYVPTQAGLRYDAFCWFDETSAVRPLPLPAVTREPETYPTGV